MTIRRPRRIGGRDACWLRRLPALQRFRKQAGPVVRGSFRDQCFCGSMEARQYRGAFWCDRCGREMLGFPREGKMSVFPE